MDLSNPSYLIKHEPFLFLLRNVKHIAAFLPSSWMACQWSAPTSLLRECHRLWTLRCKSLPPDKLHSTNNFMILRNFSVHLINYAPIQFQSQQQIYVYQVLSLSIGFMIQLLCVGWASTTPLQSSNTVNITLYSFNICIRRILLFSTSTWKLVLGIVRHKECPVSSDI